MYKLNQLLFPEMKEFDPEQIKFYDLSVAHLIQEETRKEISKTETLFAAHLQNEDSKSCKPLKESAKEKKLKREQSEQTLKDWHGFKKRELTEEDEQDLLAIKLRKYIDPKSSGKRADELNKNYMQLGTIMDDHLTGKSGRIKKKDRKERVIDQFRAEDATIGFTKKKFQDIQSNKMKNSRNKKWMKMKKAKGQRRTFAHENKEIDFN